MNALVFQIRPEGDAFYKPGIEPWSRYLTGKQVLSTILKCFIIIFFFS